MKLGRWIDKQRQRFKKNALKADRQKLLQILVDSGRYFEYTFICNNNLLNKLNFVFFFRLKWKIFVSNSKDDAEWKFIYDAVVAYGERNGYDCNVPLSYQCTVNKKIIKLGVWLAAQRLNKIKGVLNKEQDDLIQVRIHAYNMLAEEDKIA